MERLNKNYWNDRYEENNTPWDIGYASPPLTDYIDTLEDKNIRILIPGAGKGHEVAYLFNQGFQNVYVCDWAGKAFDDFYQIMPDFPGEQCLISDFFELEIEIDLIIEQTFFCAIDPSLREKYAQKTADLLADNGILAGLFFASEFPFEGPPFGGTRQEYHKIFNPYYQILEMDIAKKSIPPRQGNELFFRFQKM